MGVNYVHLSTGEDLVDLRRDTVEEDVLVKGFTAHNSKGEPIEGKLDKLNADSVDGIHLQILSSAPTENNTTMLTIVAKL